MHIFGYGAIVLTYKLYEILKFVHGIDILLQVQLMVFACIFIFCFYFSISATARDGQCEEVTTDYVILTSSFSTY